MKRTILAVAALLALVAPARAETDHALLALPTEGMQFLAYYVAEDLGFFAQEQLEMKHQVLAGVASFNAVVAGSADFAFASGASITRAAAHGQRMLAIAQMNNRPSWDVVIRKDVAEAAHFDPNAPIEQRAKVLQGKIMGTQGINALDHAYLKVVARLGGDPENMTVSAMAPVDRVMMVRTAGSGASFRGRPGRSRSRMTAAPFPSRSDRRASRPRWCRSPAA